MLKKLLISLMCVLLMAGGTVCFAEDGIVSFNSATVDELMAIEDIDIPESLAKAIVTYREEHGKFTTAEEFTKIPGMTQDFLEELNPQVTDDGDVVFDPDAEPALAPSKC
ncbi:MAG: ComEA family DNA-binding protein [Desulfopila sp.]